jgi:hypothetical protein
LTLRHASRRYQAKARVDLLRAIAVLTAVRRAAEGVGARSRRVFRARAAIVDHAVAIRIVARGGARVVGLRLDFPDAGAPHEIRAGLHPGLTIACIDPAAARFVFLAGAPLVHVAVAVGVVAGLVTFIRRLRRDSAEARLPLARRIARLLADHAVALRIGRHLSWQRGAGFGFPATLLMTVADAVAPGERRGIAGPSATFPARLGLVHRTRRCHDLPSFAAGTSVRIRATGIVGRTTGAFPAGASARGTRLPCRGRIAGGR